MICTLMLWCLTTLCTGALRRILWDWREIVTWQSVACAARWFSLQWRFRLYPVADLKIKYNDNLTVCSTVAIHNSHLTVWHIKPIRIETGYVVCPRVFRYPKDYNCREMGLTSMHRETKEHIYCCFYYYFATFFYHSYWFPELDYAYSRYCELCWDITSFF